MKFNKRDKIKICLCALFFNKYRIVRSLIYARRKTIKYLDDFINGNNIKELPESNALKMIQLTANNQSFVINKILNPLVQYAEPADYEDLDSVDREASFDVSNLRESLLDAQDDTFVFIRMHYPKLRNLPHIRHHILGKMSPKKWLCYLIIFEKKIHHNLF